MSQAKTVVKYHGTVEINDWMYSTDVAIITDVRDHPVLGNQPWVRTSTVVSYDKETGRVETLNTVYEKA